jgi:hypothetical protein
MTRVRPFVFASCPLLFALVGCAHQQATHDLDARPAPQLTSAEVSTTIPLSVLATTPWETVEGLTPEPLGRTPAMRRWASRYPDAAFELAGWVSAHPAAARKLAAWNTNQPEKMITLAGWTATDPYESFDAFRMTRYGWDDLAAIEEKDPDAFRSFLDWMRRSPPAARDLAWHPEGMSYAASHLVDLSYAMKREVLARAAH